MNSKAFVLSVATFLLGTVINPCVAKSDQRQDLVPLAVGNKWTFEKRVLDKSSSLETTKEAEAEVLEAKKIGSNTWFRYRECGDDFWVRQGIDGQYEAEVSQSGDALQIDKQFLFFRYPVEQTPQTYQAGPNTIKVLADAQQVTIPAGEFSCCVYELSDAGGSIRMYVAPGVGLVKHRHEDKDQVKVMELTSYKLNRGPAGTE